MPEQTSRPVALVPLYQIVKLWIFTNLDQRGVRALPEKMAIPISFPTERTRNNFSSNSFEKKSVPSSPPQIRFLFEGPYLCCARAKNAMDVRRSARAGRCLADSVARCHLQRVRGQVLVYVFVVLGDSAQRTPPHGPRHTPHLPIQDAAREQPTTTRGAGHGRKRKMWKTLKNQDETTKWSLETKCWSYQSTQANIDEMGIFFAKCWLTFGFVSVRDEKPNRKPVSWLCSLTRTTRKALQVFQACLFLPSCYLSPWSPGTHLRMITQDSKHPVCPWADSSWPLLGPKHLCTKAQLTGVHTPPHLKSRGNDGPRNHEKNQDPFIAAPAVSFVLPSWPAREVGCTTAFVGKRTGWATSAIIAVSGGKDQFPKNWCLILRGQRDSLGRPLKRTACGSKLHGVRCGNQYRFQDMVERVDRHVAPQVLLPLSSQCSLCWNGWRDFIPSAPKNFMSSPAFIRQ